MFVGFANNDTTPVAATTAWTSVQLHQDTTNDANAIVLSNNAHWSHLEVDVNTIAGGATRLQAVLTWDSAGQRIAAGPSDMATMYLTAADATIGAISFAIDKDMAPPAGQTASNRVYLWVRTDVGTLSVLRARLVFSMDR